MKNKKNLIIISLFSVILIAFCFHSIFNYKDVTYGDTDILDDPAYKYVPDGNKVEYGNFEETKEIVKEVMRDFYMRGANLQYNLSKTIYGNFSPEEITSQDIRYSVCAAYNCDVYDEALGMCRLDGTRFPIYNTSVTSAAKGYYNASNIESERFPLDGKFLIYYEDKSNKYVYDMSSNSDFDYSTFAQSIQPGDVFVYTGHVLVAYDSVQREDGSWDVLLLNSSRRGMMRSRITTTSNLSYNMFKSPLGYNNIVDVEQEGTVMWKWLSNESSFIDKNKQLNCSKESCAIIRPYYEGENNKTVFNYGISTDKYEKSQLRLKYPGLYIEKTVNVNDNNNINIGETLTYTIKIKNRSNTTYNPVNYDTFFIEETINDLVEYQSSNNNGKYQNGIVKWTFNGLKSDEEISIEYTVKVKENISNVDKLVISKGIFYSNNKAINITTGNVENLIVPKVTIDKNIYASCYNLKKTSYNGLNLINEIYKCVNNIDYNFNLFDFEKLIERKKINNNKSGSGRLTYKPIDANHELFGKMILKNYWNSMILYYTDSTTETVAPTLSYFSSSDKKLRSKTIMPNDFKDGDILIYLIDYDLLSYDSNSYVTPTSPTNRRYTSEDGIYAYIYIDGKFVGLNGSGSTERNEFTYKYYGNTNTDININKKLYEFQPSNSDTKTTIYHEYIKFSGEKQSNLLEFANYQTLFDKDYYVILRPELVMREKYKINIESLPKKTKYIQNYENINLEGLVFNLVYNDASKEQLSLDDVNITGFDNSKVGKNTLIATYEGMSTTFDVEIVQKSILNLEIINEPNKKQYIQNYEKLDLSGGKIKVTYDDTTTSEINMNNENVKISGYDNSKIGKNSITVTYEGKSLTFEVEIVQKSISKLEIINEPNKKQYIQNYEILDLTGGKIKATYNDTTFEEIVMSSEKVSIVGFDNSKVGKNTITVTYLDLTTYFDVEIKIKEIIKIDVVRLPQKLYYTENSNERLDLTEGKIRITYNDTTTEEIDMNNEKLDVYGFENTEIGEKTIIIKYFDFETSFNIAIISKQVDKIRVKTKPIKLVYIQGADELDLSGGVLEIEYNNGTISDISIENENVNISGFNNSTLGICTVNVEYLGKKTSFNVKVSAKNVVDIKIKKNPLKTKYIYKHELLDLSGGMIQVIYNDGSNSDISLTNSNVKVSGFNNNKIGKNNIYVEYNGYSMSFQVEIISKEIKKIEFIKEPLKKEYIQNIESLDLTGGILKITYNDKTTTEMSTKNKMIDVIGFDNSVEGKQKVSLKYEQKIVHYEIEVIKKRITGIEIIKLPNKTLYNIEDTKLDLTGGILEITYNDGATSKIEMLDNQIIVDGFENKKIGTNQLVLEYEDFKINFDIKVIDTFEEEKKLLSPVVVLSIILSVMILLSIIYIAIYKRS